MRVLSLQLANFRNYAALALEPSGGACVLVGRNAQGKSNLLEALALLATGKSFRTTRESDMIRTGTPAANIAARVRTKHGELQAACILAAVGEGSRKRFLRNGRAVPYADFLGGVCAVTFTPYDLALAMGPAALRRRMLNAALSQSSRAYYHQFAQYGKLLVQKNALLRAPGLVDRDLLETYNEQLADYGAQVICARAAYVRRLASESASIHARWVGAQQAFEVSYKPSPEQEDEAPSAVAAALRSALSKALSAELARKTSLVGPHRDEIALALDGQPLARFGSQGQQRTAVLALKAAEYVLLQAAAGEPPLLLLDDVFSELDAARRQAFLQTIGDYDQAFITATELPQLPAGVRATPLCVEAGGVTSMEQTASA